MPMTTDTVDRPATTGTNRPSAGRRTASARRGPLPELWFRILAKIRDALGPEDGIGRAAARPADDDLAAHWRLRVAVEEDELDGGYIARCVDLPGCMSQGETKEEALENLNDAIGGVIAARLNSHIQAHEYKTVKGPNGDTVEFEICV
jgi:predicted RNase H-like HicB family nuclease